MLKERLLPALERLVKNMPIDIRNDLTQYFLDEYEEANENIMDVEIQYPSAIGVPEEVSDSEEFKRLVDYKNFTNFLYRFMLMQQRK